MTVTYRPRGVCSREMRVEVKDGVVQHVEIAGGCPGNLQGIMRLVEGMPAAEAVARLRGIRCGGKATSCPDQLSIAIEQAMQGK